MAYEGEESSNTYGFPKNTLETIEMLKADPDHWKPVPDKELKPPYRGRTFVCIKETLDSTCRC